MTTWLPARKIKDEQDNLISIEPMSSIEAKRASADRALLPRSARRRREEIDVYGHAAAELKIDFNQSILSPVIKAMLSEQGIESRHIKSLYAYISWFPEATYVTGRSIDLDQRNQFLSNVQEKEVDLQHVKQRVLDFIGKEYQAVNSDIMSDTYQYGLPDPNRIFTFSNIDFESVILICFQMMKCEVNNSGVLTMTTALPDATYYGLDMLRQHRQMTGYDRDFPEPISAEHVCTTAVLRLIEAGIGKENFRLIVKKVLEENPELSHGFPIVELTHAIVKQVSLEAELQNPFTPKIT